MRFFTGVLTGAIIVGAVIGIERLGTSDVLLLIPTWTGFLFCLSLLLSILLLSLRERHLTLPDIDSLRVFLIHSFLFSLILWFFSLVPDTLWLSAVSGVLFWYVLRASIEESTKHIGYASTSLQELWSKETMLLMTFFVVLGFVFVENILYLKDLYLEEWTREFVRHWVLRSLFSLIVHIFFAFLITYAWWRAIAYGMFSPRYFLVLLGWILLSIWGHTLYNTFVETNFVFWILTLTLIWLFAMSAMMWRKEG